MNIDSGISALYFGYHLWFALMGTPILQTIKVVKYIFSRGCGTRESCSYVGLSPLNDYKMINEPEVMDRQGFD